MCYERWILTRTYIAGKAILTERFHVYICQDQSGKQSIYMVHTELIKSYIAVDFVWITSYKTILCY